MVTRLASRLTAVLFAGFLLAAGATGPREARTGQPGGNVAHASDWFDVVLGTNLGCGPNAVFRDGDSITIFFISERRAAIRLFNIKPNEVQLLFDHTVEAGRRIEFTSVVGLPLGGRRLRLEARDAAGNFQVRECTFTVLAAAPSPEPFEAEVSTERGCGNGAEYRVGETVVAFFKLNQTRKVRLIDASNGERVLRENFTAQARTRYQFSFEAREPLGAHTLILEVDVDGFTITKECRFNVASAPSPGPFEAEVNTERGCGSGAEYRVGETLVVFVKVNQRTPVRLLRTGPGGEQVLRDRFTAEANQRYRFEFPVPETRGEYTLILEAEVEGFTITKECVFIVIAGTPQAPDVFLETSKGCGTPALFKVGEPLSFFFKVPLDTNVTLVNRRPDGDQLIARDFPVKANQLIQVPGTAGFPVGVRTIELIVRVSGQDFAFRCTYEVVESDPPDNSIGLTLTTHRGCGPGAVFKPKEDIAIDFTVAEHTHIWLKIVGTKSTLHLLDSYFAEAGRRFRAIVDAPFAEGTYTIVLIAKKDHRGGRAECSLMVAK